jgi:acyl-CoA reductase-like NAD-dependent aldehyde dehydrogenase
VDVDAVASEVAMGVFWNTGQVCTAIKRIYIHQDIYQKMLDALAKAVQELRIGEVIGPVQNETQYNKLKELFEDARNNSYTIKVGGQVKESKGFYLEPTIVDNPPVYSKLVTGEQFVSWPYMLKFYFPITTLIQFIGPNCSITAMVQRRGCYQTG